MKLDAQTIGTTAGNLIAAILMGGFTVLLILIMYKLGLWIMGIC